ncbi:AT-rich interactive domain-containing protein 4-like isoform X2 [Asparagus officinalis]|uniref:AT-rich interactive domain-containing protein 4-like isoform X2 n=1 Tax=Asparagus officinalis TaxID=4686 RepID=UPI00098E7C82|nr:AT-rich interactive domain-containing protein 4-like isoform X2 [Asparagus officinalis]
MGSSLSHIWDAFQLAFASFRLYCIKNSYVLPVNYQTAGDNIWPLLLGDEPKINITPEEPKGEEGTDPCDIVPRIKIHHKDVDMRLLICGLPCSLDPCLLGSLEDGLSALLNIEIRGSNLQDTLSEAETDSNGTMMVKYYFTTCSHAYFSVLVSGTAATCSDNQLLESLIKKELVENCHRFIKALPNSKEKSREHWNTLSIAAGAPVFEIFVKVPAWASEILKYLARELCYRSLVALGVGAIAGVPVTSFDKEDADRLLFFCKRGKKVRDIQDSIVFRPPKWHAPLVSMRKAKPVNSALLRPVPHIRPLPKNPFLDDGVKHVADFIPSVSALGNTELAPAPSRRSEFTSRFLKALQFSMSPLPLQKHGCKRSHIGLCSEGEFLQDLKQYIIHRGQSWLVPKGGISEFPDAVLNGSQLDLFNLYKEVVSRGGFSQAKGINWRGQIFINMRNYTGTHRLTSVGTILKDHYMTYLLEYELAHDDVEAECCILCESGDPGNWVNCSVCSEWAHYDCDQRPNIASFKDYAKTGGLEYICPNCT